MATILPLLTAASLLVHMLLGCCWHHGHRVAGACPHAIEASDHRHGDHDADHPHDSNDPDRQCDGNRCVVVLGVKVKVAHATTAQGISVIALEQPIVHAHDGTLWHRYHSLRDVGSLLPLYLAHQVLRI